MNQTEGKLMIKNAVVTTLALLLFTGCGGGGETNSDNKPITQTRLDKQYNLWSYLVPTSDSTHTFTHIQNGSTSTYKTTYTVTNKQVEEVADYAKDEKTIYQIVNDEINVKFEKSSRPNGMYKLFMTADIGDVVTVRTSTCKLSNHLDTFQAPNSDKSFADVIEITCNNIPGYYQKGVGEIAQIEDSSGKNIRVLSN
jgi:hypothetical protein